MRGNVNSTRPYSILLASGAEVNITNEKKYLFNFEELTSHSMTVTSRWNESSVKATGYGIMIVRFGDRYFDIPTYYIKSTTKTIIGLNFFFKFEGITYKVSRDNYAGKSYISKTFLRVDDIDYPLNFEKSFDNMTNSLSYLPPEHLMINHNQATILPTLQNK